MLLILTSSGKKPDYIFGFISCLKQNGQERKWDYVKVHDRCVNYFYKHELCAGSC